MRRKVTRSPHGHDDGNRRAHAVHAGPDGVFFEPAKTALHSRRRRLHTPGNTAHAASVPAWENRLDAPDPDILSCLPTANYGVFSIAGNPAYGYGPAGIEDTSTWLHDHESLRLAPAWTSTKRGAPPSSSAMAQVRVSGRDCIGVKANAASKSKAGTAYVDILTHFEQVRWPGEPPAIYTWAEP